MTRASANPTKLTVKKTSISWLIVWNYNPIFRWGNSPQYMTLSCWPAGRPAVWPSVRLKFFESAFSIRISVPPPPLWMSAPTPLLWMFVPRTPLPECLSPPLMNACSPAHEFQTPPPLINFCPPLSWISVPPPLPNFCPPPRWNISPTINEYPSQPLFECLPPPLHEYMSHFHKYVSNLYVSVSNVWIFVTLPHLLRIRASLFVFNLATIGAFVWLFEPFGGICGVWVRSQIFFGTYLCRQSTLVLEVKPYLFVFILTTFGASFSFFLVLQGYLFGPLRLTLGSGSGSKKLFGTY